jgi:hypothetical protein
MRHFRRCAVILFLLPITAVLTGSALADTMRMNFRAPERNDIRGVYTHSSLFSHNVKSHFSLPHGGTFSVPNAQSHLLPSSHLPCIAPVFHKPINVTHDSGLPHGTISPVTVPEPGEASLLLSVAAFAIVFLSVRKRLGLRVVAQER